MSDVTTDGKRVIESFLSAQNELRLAKDRLNSAECALSNAETVLAKWLMPADMKPGEKIAVWHGSSLFQVELAAVKSFAVPTGKEVIRHEPQVTIRTRGKELR